MDEPTGPDDPESAGLRRAVRRRLADLDPDFDCIAEGLLGESSRIDLLVRDAAGRPWVVLIGEGGDDAALFTRALAHAAWVSARIDDWQQLAPELVFKAGDGCGAWVVCPDFAPETLAAARVVAAEGTRPLRLARWSGSPHGASGELSLAPVALGEAGYPAGPSDRLELRDGSRAAEGPAAFRSGLRDSDFALSPAERRSILDRSRD